MAVSRSRRSTSGIVFIIAGALVLLSLLVPLLGLSAPWLFVLAEVALAVAFIILAVGAVNSTLAKVALIAAAVGWAILAVFGLGLGLPLTLLTIAGIVAAIGGLIGAILLYVGKEVTNASAIIFIIAMILGALFLFALIGTLALGTLGTVVVVLFGAALIATGYYFTRKGRGRR